ncbi:unnamed protein product [marine sediment metagenome]|uniref:Uncharacterized protein n=1 Tax=marine sediment metagenome TaxID=412755 RepID=X0SQS0_9ZZZZ
MIDTQSTEILYYLPSKGYYHHIIDFVDEGGRDEKVIVDINSICVIPACPMQSSDPYSLV